MDATTPSAGGRHVHPPAQAAVAAAAVDAATATAPSLAATARGFGHA